jgi:hypothetical protein
VAGNSIEVVSVPTVSIGTWEKPASSKVQSLLLSAGGRYLYALVRNGCHQDQLHVCLLVCCAGALPDLVGLLGPELMLLTSPAAAAATTGIQHSSRELKQQWSMGRDASLTVPSSSSIPIQNRQAGRSFMGGSFRHSSSMRAAHSCSDPAPASKSLNLSNSAPAVGAAPAAAAAAAAAAEAAAEAEAAAAVAAGGGVGSAGTSQAAEGSDINNHAADSQQQQSGQKQTQISEVNVSGHGVDQLQENYAGAAADTWVANSVAGSATSYTSPEVLSPFLLHQRERVARQASFSRSQHSSRSMRLCMDHLQMLSLLSSSQSGAQTSTTPQPGSIISDGRPKQPESAPNSASQVLGQELQHSSPAEHCAVHLPGRVAGKADIDLAEAECDMAGAGGQLPLAAVDRCRRLRHEGCCHSPQLEKRMQEKMEHHLEAQVWCGSKECVC